MRAHAVILKSIALLAAFICAGAASAQYVRTASTGTYTERTGNPSASNLLIPNTQISGNAVQVNLPFDFTYFNRTYRTCFMNTSGTIAFESSGAGGGGATNLTPVVGAGSRSMIFVFAASNLNGVRNTSNHYNVFFESGRVVFQWRNIRVSGDYILHNFQCHLLSTGNIEFYYGPETTVAGFTETMNFASGLVNSDGTTAVAGFGNVLTVQTVRPANGDVVTFAPTFTPAVGINIAAPTYNLGTQYYKQGDTNVPVLGFRAIARGAGATMTQLSASVAGISTGESATVRLIRDTAPLGSFNGETTVSTVTLTASSNAVFMTLSEAVTAGTVDYLIVADFTTLVSYSGIILSNVNGSTALPANSIWGGCYGTFASNGLAAKANSSAIGSMIFAEQDTAAPVLNGATNVRGLSMQVWNQQGFAAGTFTSVTFTMTVSGITNADITAVRLWRDGGTLGVNDGGDTQIGTTQVGAATITFTPLSEAPPTTGSYYLLTFDVNPATTASGTVQFGQTTTPFVFVPAATSYSQVASTGETRRILGTNPAVFLNNNLATSYSALPVQPSDTNLPANSFQLRTSAGTGSVTQLVFTCASTTGISAARLYVDGGTSAGRFDIGDTAVTGTAAAIGATTITFAAITGQTLSTTPITYLMVIDLTGAASGTQQLNLATTGVTSTPATVVGATSTGTNFTIGTGAAMAGVDVSFGTPASSGTTGAEQGFVLMTVQCTARGTGGSAPTFGFAFPNHAGSAVYGCFIEVYLDTGTIGSLDSSDVNIGLTPQIINSFGLAATNFVTTGTTRNFLVVVRGILAPYYRLILNGIPATGRGIFQLVSIGGGTNLRLLPAGQFPNQSRSTITVNFSASGGGGGGSDEGGCSTGNSDSRLNFALLAGVMGLMFVALRTRRRAA